jgi:predicted nuclease of predicted toxin-antitoxin system
VTKFLANENVPGEVVEAARQAGHDLASIADLSPGADDDAVLRTALADNRVLVTFDKDFGEMAFREGKTATCGVVLLRPRVRSPAYLAQLRVVPLPD